MAMRNDSSQMRDCLTCQESTEENSKNEATLSKQCSNKRTLSQTDDQRPESTGPKSPPGAKNEKTDTCLSAPPEKKMDTVPISLLQKLPQCYMRLEYLVSNAQHTVLIDTNEFRTGKIVPYKGHHVWDANHVKLPTEHTKQFNISMKGPHSGHHTWDSNYAATGYSKTGHSSHTEGPQNVAELIKQFATSMKGQHNGHHVGDSNHAATGYSKTGHSSRWEAIQKALQGLMSGLATVDNVEHAIKSYNGAHGGEWPFDALHAYERHIPAQENNLSFVIGKMARLALKLPELIRHSIPLLRSQNGHAITLSQVQISCLLANAFFCTFPHRNATKPGSEFSNFPTINFSKLFGDGNMHKIQKLRALFHYFDTVTQDDTRPDGLVTFERICVPKSGLPNWKQRTETVSNLHVSPTGTIEEDGKGMLQVDFASKFVGGGVLGKGLLQEEILFIMCPELIVARLFTEKLSENECLKITGVQTYSCYSGYRDSFEWTGSYNDTTGRDEWRRRYCQIVAIDALCFEKLSDQFTMRNITRELNKAYVGFKRDPGVPSDYTPAIATGNWGCGAFNGDPRLKSLIQIMAAAVAKRDMAFFTFGNTVQAKEMKDIQTLLIKKKVTVGALYELLNQYCDYYNHNRSKPMNVYEFIMEKTFGWSNL